MRVRMDVDRAHLARGVDLGRVPLGLVLEVNLVAHEVGFGFMQRDLRLCVEVSMYCLFR